MIFLKVLKSETRFSVLVCCSAINFIFFANPGRMNRVHSAFIEVILYGIQDSFRCNISFAHILFKIKINVQDYLPYGFLSVAGKVPGIYRFSYSS